MKTPTPRWLNTPLLLLMLLAGAPLAQAYYDPGIQRWINRDPVRELGHFSFRNGHCVQVGTGEQNLSKFTRNSPMNVVDPDGLVERDWPVNGMVCNACVDGTAVYILVEGRYFTLPAGECTANKPGFGTSTDVDGVWICPPAGACSFYRVNPGLVAFMACADPPSHCPIWNGEKGNKNSPRKRGAPNDTPPTKRSPPIYRPPGRPSILPP